MNYIDANVIIRLIEGSAMVRDPIRLRLAQTNGPIGASMMSSKLALLECRCKPLREANQPLLQLYDEFFSGNEFLLTDIDNAVIEKATDLRARLNVKTPDAIHLASAIVAGAETFLTGDQGLSRCTDVKVEIL